MYQEGERRNLLSGSPPTGGCGGDITTGGLLRWVTVGLSLPCLKGTWVLFINRTSYTTILAPLAWQ